MPSLWQWIGYPSASMPCPLLPQLTPQELHTFSLSMAGGTRLPEAVISDRGSAFVSNFSRDLATLLDIQLTPSTAYHLQTDGQMEQVNQEIEAYLWCRWENGPICEPPTETDLMVRACHYYHSEIYNEFDT